MKLIQLRFVSGKIFLLKPLMFYNLKELYAYGSSNIFASFFGCFPAAGSLTRTTMMNYCGGRSQV